MKYFKYAKIALVSMAVFSQSSQAALYQISELNAQDISKSTFPIDVNESGDVVLSVTYDNIFPLPEFNIPIDLSLIDFENETLQENLTDIEAAQNGDFNLEDYATILGVIRSGQSALTTQRLVPWLSYVSENGVLEYIPGFDEIDADYSGYAKSSDTRVQALNDNGVIVGNSQAKPYKIDYVNESGDEFTFLVRDFGNRGFVDLNGIVVGLESESDIAGGFTEATDVNNSLQVTGSEIYGPSDVISDAADNCEDDEIRGDQPIEVCLQRLHDSLSASHSSRAVIWELDSDGNVVDKRTFGLPFEPEEDDERRFGGEALAINENGLAVGRTSNFYEDNTEFESTYAAVFSGDEVISFTDRNEYFSSIATDINDNNLVTGYGVRDVNGIRRSKFFVYDVNSTELTFPDDFFPGSSSVAKSINNMGQIVGEGEVETTLSSDRRREGFIYDHNDNTFHNLNDLTSCDTPYTIVQANSINDSGQIAAVARIRRTDLDIQGNVLLNDDGTELQADQLVAVLLNPIPGGEIDDCTGTDSQNNTQQRQGGAGGWGMMLLLLLPLFRRFKK